MNSSKNVGRKRLGRIPITSAKPATVNRSCQIVQRTNGGKKNISRSDENYPVDLSFSSSFAHDLDVDLMSALDKMETEYGNQVKGDEATKSDTHTINANMVSKNKQNLTNATKKTILELGKGEVKSASFKNVSDQSTPARIRNQSTAGRLGSKKNVTKVSTAENSISDSFHDLSFASPMEISTPQIFKAKRTASSSTRLSASRTTDLSVIKKSVEKNIRTASKIKTSTPQVTPRRSLRTNSGQKGRNQLKKKRVLNGLEDSHTEGKNVENPNKSDFFRSLMVENVSLEETNITQNDVIMKIKSPENHLQPKPQTDEHKHKGNKLIQNSNYPSTVGHTGTANARGTVGNTGPANDQGTVGHTGTANARGTVGNTGPANDQGTVGHTGTANDRGTVGHTGTANARGTVGNTGPANDRGTVGHTGTANDRGTVGHTGTANARGTVGNTGPANDRGTVGHTGTANARGTVGNTGPANDRGTVGHTGTANDRGTVGHTGTANARGTVGNTGPANDRGTVGHIGTANDRGTLGRTGPAAVENNENSRHVTTRNHGENDTEINPEDLPLIPTRGGNKHDTSNSTSIIGKSLEIQPDLEADQLALSSWGLPAPVLKQYHSRGITHMFQWQAECLLMGNVLGGGNLVYSAPTSAGKTMVAELLVLKRVMETRKKAIIILPFVSVTREKMFYLQDLYQDAGIRVSGFMGHYAPAGGFSSVDVAVCTIEKGNSLINRMLEENKLDQLGIIVIDELHLIGDRHRGYLLELLLTKISYMSQKAKQNTLSDTSFNIQVVGMSATLPNLDLLAQWLNADLYRTDYRPVPLSECVKIGTAIYDSSLSLVRDIDTKYAVKGDEDHVVPLCIETIRDGHSILIFCPTKNWCEKLSETVARELYNLLRNPEVAVAGKGFVKASDLLVLPLDQLALRDTIEQLRRTAVGLDSVLGRTVQFGVAYHHAGLTFDERDIVEGAFRQGILKVLIATSTLSSGVNLPARRVLIRTPVFHGQLIDFLTYKQMIGRAGRKGVDTAGESILLCKPNERPKAEKLVKGALPAVQSTLVRGEGEPLSSSMKRAILEVVVSGVAMSPAEVSCYASCTLLAASLTKEENHTQDLIQQCVQFLQENEFVCTQKIKGSDGVESERFVPTQLGAAVLASSISPDEGLVVFSELQRARQCFVLENELHIIYQVTPIYAQIDSIDWYQYFSIWETLTAGMRKVAELIGIQESFLAKAVRGRILTKTSAQLKLLAIHKRFYTALVLHDLVQETPVNVVARKYNCNKGQLQSLQQSAATFAGMVTVFCARLGWSNLELILSQFQNRLTFGVQRELIDLVRISALNGQRARVMYNGGYQTVAALASAHPADVEALLKNSAPFQSNKKQDSESEWEAEQRRKTRCIFLTGRKGVTEYEAALAVISEAKSIIQEELGGLGIQWKEGDSEPAPQLKSPVLLSPLAATRRDKKIQNKCLSNPKSSKITSPSNKAVDSNKPAAACVISPPATKSDPKVTKEIEIDSMETNSRKESPTKVADVVNIEDTENLAIQNDSCRVYKQKQNGDARAIDKLSDSRGPVKKIIVEQHRNNSEHLSEANKDILINPLAKRNENLNIEQKNVITTTAVIETIPKLSADKKHSNENVVAEKTVKDTVKCQSKSNTMETCEEIVEKDDTLLPGNLKTINPTRIVPDKVNVQKRLQESKLKESHTTGLFVACDKSTEIIEDVIKGKPEMAIIEQEKQNRKSDVNEGNVELGEKQNQTIERIQGKHVAEKSNSNANTNVKVQAEPKFPVNCNTINNAEQEPNAVNGQIQEYESKIAALNDRGTNVMNGMLNESDFGESFMIDTQSLKSLENSRNKKATCNTGNVCTVMEKVVKQIETPVQTNADHNVENAFSEGLFSEDFEMDSFNASNRNILPCNQSQSHGLDSKPVCPMKGSQNIDRGVVTHDRTGARFNVSDSGSEIDISHNALDMNISQCSGEDMFNQSADLVAASNYERVVLSGDSRVEEINDSYHDLHIPYQSGQEKCFEKTDASAPLVANVVTNLCENYGAAKSKTCNQVEKSPAIGQQLNVLGQFSSQRPTKTVVNCQEKLHEDLAMALEMGESFSSTFNVPTQPEVNVIDKNNVNDKSCDSEDHFGDSLTVSMVENVLQEPNEIKNSANLCDSNNAYPDTVKANSEKNETKHICDRNSETESIMKSKQSVIPKTHYQSENCKNPGKSQFLTPKREAVKRLRGSPAVRESKIQKVKDVGYSTPEALGKHTRRTNIAKSNDKDNVDDSEVDPRSKRKRKSNDNVSSVSEKSRRGSVSEMNTSTGSDCVPPTPPDEAPTGSLLALVRTPARSPLVTLQPVSPFSPKLKRNIKNQQISVKNASDDLVNNKPATGVSSETDDVIEKVTTNRTAVNAKSKHSKDDKNCTFAAPKNDSVIKSCSKSRLDEKEMKRSVICNGIAKTATETNDDNREAGQDNDEDDEVDENKENEDFLSPSFIDPDESGMPLTQSSFSIIDVCGDKRLFKTFIMEWRTKARYAVSLACERMSPDRPGGGIGANFKQGEPPVNAGMRGNKDSGIPVESLGILIVGIAVSWENRDAYYISFTHEQPHGDPDDSLAPPLSDTDISIAIRVKAVKSVLQQAVCKQQPVTMVMFDVKAHFRALAEGCGFAPKGQCEDPKVACWMLDPGAKEKNLHRMVTNLLPTEVHMLHGIGGGIGVSSLGMSPQNPGSGRYRATTEAVLVRHLGEYFRASLEKEEIYGVYTDVEMPSAVTLCRMELNGFGFSQDESENQKTVMTAKLSALEEQAYMLAGHPFSLSATEDVAQVLYVELQLPPNGDPSSMPAPRSLAPKRGGAPRRGRGKPQYSTSKDILEKLKKLHPLPGIILEWRRITNALTKTVFPLQKEKVHCDWLSMYRIYGDCQLHTATGRVSMTEPNLQNVPKDFDILLPDLIGESPPPNTVAPVGRRTRAGSSKLQQVIGQRQVAKVTEENTGSQFCVSMRHAFIPFKGGVMLAADYSQLELRMISYLSNDPKLIGILNKDGDVFKLITAQWKNIKPEHVTPEQRAQAKQVCYGMIYGIGAKALGEQLDVEDNDAAVFIETFKAKYPGMRTYLRQTVEDCRTKGYVQTMLGRKRYLQPITSTNPHARAQAERQAVNTTVQGSAADLVKMAMIKIDERLAEMFPNTQYTHKHKLTNKHPSRVKTPPEGAYLVLQLHDELIYEVSETHVHTIAQLVKHCMETVMKLPVKMPVKVKVGPSWGKLEDYEL